PGVEDVAGTVLGAEGRVLGVGEPVRVRQGVEVVQVPVELVEAVQRRQVSVQIAEVVFAELAGGIAHRLEDGGGRDGLARHADAVAGPAPRRQAGPNGQLARDEVGATRGAARLGIVVGEYHALRR